MSDVTISKEDIIGKIPVSLKSGDPEPPQVTVVPKSNSAISVVPIMNPANPGATKMILTSPKVNIGAAPAGPGIGHPGAAGDTPAKIEVAKTKVELPRASTVPVVSMIPTPITNTGSFPITTASQSNAAPALVLTSAQVS